MPVDSKVGRRHWGWLILLVTFRKFQHFNLVSKIFQKLFKPLPCHKSIGKMLHAICISAVAVSLRWASCGPWASCLTRETTFVTSFLHFWTPKPFWKGINSKRKEFRVDPFSERGSKIILITRRLLVSIFEHQTLAEKESYFYRKEFAQKKEVKQFDRVISPESVSIPFKRFLSFWKEIPVTYGCEINLSQNAYLAPCVTRIDRAAIWETVFLDVHHERNQNSMVSLIRTFTVHLSKP